MRNLAVPIKILVVFLMALITIFSLQVSPKIQPSQNKEQPTNKFETSIQPVEKPVKEKKVEYILPNHLEYYKYTNNPDTTNWIRYPNKEKYGETSWEMFYPNDWEIFGEGWYLQFTKKGAQITIYFKEISHDLQGKDINYFVNSEGYKLDNINGLDSAISEEDMYIQIDESTLMYIQVDQRLWYDDRNLPDKYIYIKEAFTIINNVRSSN